MSEASPGTPPGDVDPSAAALVAGLLGAGFTGPVLVVARCDAVARGAPAWAAAFAGVGLVHRVRVVSGIASAPSPVEVDDIAAEAASLGAALIVVDADDTGGAAPLALRIHAASGRPAAVWSDDGGTLTVLPDGR